jgi:predicted RNA-binding protein Jag
MSEELIKKVEAEVREFFSKLGFEIEMKISRKDNAFKIDIQSRESQELVGEKGQMIY